MNFSDKIVLVTGASRGIGREIARQFAEKNARVAVHYHKNAQSAQETLSKLAGTGHAIFQADLTDAQQIEKLVGSVIEKMETIDILVNNAGIFEEHPIQEVDYTRWQEAWQETLATNLLGPANLTFCVVNHMIKHGGGKIVNVSSRGAFRGEPDAPAYGASKAGLNAMSQSLAKALAPYNIFIYVVAPGFVETDMARPILQGPAGEAIRQQSPLGRVARPDEVARTVVFLASEGTDFLTGCIVDINGASYLRT
ncbi:MAG: SDR family oxidoreductase [Calditrichaeota bacterium]|nr:MAG: SDR family oxidoreductase [Calditrichota bacterium]